MFRIEFSIEFETPTAHCPAETVCHTESVGTLEEAEALALEISRMDHVASIGIQVLEPDEDATRYCDLCGDHKTDTDTGTHYCHNCNPRPQPDQKADALMETNTNEH